MNFEGVLSRATKKERIYSLFRDNIGIRFYSNALHATFGSAFRSRVSDINNDPSSTIKIFNKTNIKDDGEVSVYWAVDVRSREVVTGG